ncbi:glycosyltransferase family 32 protein [Parabacteroides goldsteinii]|uniref:glycosyltransferase family 32 protein n=1 Tax=Parabacteroides goldsteinii TaxID=328812 RepID=UPI0025ADC5F8|nr:glycosyltransferase [Parabacteroides goldsteinii]
MKLKKTKYMIPKKIHYCWFGGNPLPSLALKCIESWRKYLPDYEIKEWNESNFDLSYNDYVREAYEARKWAFITDVVRLYAMVTEGGIYMDTDVEVLKSLDSLLSYDAVSGFESETRISTGLMACRKGHPLFEELLREYDGIHFKRFDGSLDMTTNVTRITNTCLKYGFVPNNQKQTVNGFTLLPKDYLCPIEQDGHILRLTSNTLTIHHFAGSWVEGSHKFKRNVARFLGGRLSGTIVRMKHSLIRLFSLGQKRENR